MVMAAALVLVGCSSAMEARPDPVVPLAPSRAPEAPAPAVPVATDSRAVAYAERLARLTAVRRLRCTFAVRATANWDGGTPTVRLPTDTMSFDFDTIDTVKKTARMVGPAGAVDVTVVGSLAGLTFLETTQAGNTFMTSVVPWTTPAGELAAGYARHLIVTSSDGPPVFSQSYGSCRPL